MSNWNQILQEVNDEVVRNSLAAQQALDTVRRKYLRSLSGHTNRNTIAYYSGFLSKSSILGIEINDEDKNGLMMAIHGLDRAKGLDLILHTPGGSIAAAESIVDYLKRMFGKNIRAIVPQIAMSAGTMIACACNTILMGKQSNLGPVDPQLRGIPAAGVIEEFRKAYEEISRDPQKISVWQFIIQQYPPSFLGQCENSIEWAKDFVRQQLEDNMFADNPDKNNLAEKIVMALTDFSGNKAHDRHIHFDECKEIGLMVRLLEEEQTLQDLVLTVHHCYMHALMNTPVFKMIENQNGAAFVKHQGPVQVPIPGPR
ncbi:MAG: SDH family Clp fold serine proteinase [Acidobacteriaceae bacterium]